MKDSEIIRRNEKWIKEIKEIIKVDEKTIKSRKATIEALRKQNRELKGRK